jgi:hypothetical protein
MTSYFRPAFPFDGAIKVGVLLILISLFGNFPFIGFFPTAILFAVFGFSFVFLPEFISTKYIITSDILIIQSLYWRKKLKLNECTVEEFEMSSEIKSNIRRSLFYLDKIQIKNFRIQFCVSYRAGKAILITHKTEKFVLTPHLHKVFYAEMLSGIANKK